MKPAVTGYPSAVTGEIQHKAGRGSQPGQLLHHYFDLLGRVGIADPAGIADLVARADGLHGQGYAKRSRADQRAGIARRLADGELSGDQADKELAKLEDPEAVRQAESERREVYKQGADRTYRQAIVAVHEAGEDAFLGPLRTAIAECVADPGPVNAQRWDDAHELAQLLRRLGGLASAEGAKWWEYSVAHPDALHDYRVAHARTVRPQRNEEVDGGVFVDLVPVGGPPVTLPLVAAHADEWQPGLLSAREVVDTVKAIHQRHRQELANTPKPKPATAQVRHH